jgi:hypothetical protein
VKSIEVAILYYNKDEEKREEKVEITENFE